jgi:hypothetical protein
LFQHRVDIFQRLIVPKTQHSKASASQEGRPSLICFGLHRVLTPIELDH